MAAFRQPMARLQQAPVPAATNLPRITLTSRPSARNGVMGSVRLAFRPGAGHPESSPAQLRYECSGTWRR